ncbi:MAG: fumarylacetoacetate hydrolase family protein [Haloarculaceae archaeon]
MKRIRFLDPAGHERVGRLEGDLISAAGREYSLEAVTVRPPTDPSKLVCVGLNYSDHAAETDSEIPERPLLFAKFPNAVAAPGSTVELPADKRIDYEGELGVVVGSQCRNVSADRAEDVIAGYTCVDDLSNRDDQRSEQNWIRGKTFDDAAPMGPVLATPEEVPDDATIEVRVNGETRQSSSIDNLLFSIPELIEEITSYLTLEPGDVILTGTPAGVGPVSDGDTVEVEIEGIGTLSHDVAAGEFEGDVQQDFLPDL